MNRNSHRFFAAALSILMLTAAVFAQSKISVRLVSDANVEGELIKLGDLARIAGGDQSERVERLKNISLGYAPNVGMTREVTREKIALAIAAAGFAAGEIALSSTPAVSVHRAGQEISQTRLREAVEKTIADLFTGKEVSTVIVRLDVPLKIDVPVGEIEMRVDLGGVRNYFAPFTATIEIRLNNAVVRRLAANVEIEAFADVLVAVKDLTANEKIAAGDVRLENRRLRKPFVNYLRDANNLRGLKLVKNVSNGGELVNEYFAAETVVKFGDAVRIVGQSGDLQLSVNGEARANGKIGDRIAVKNSQSNIILQAVVVDEGLVKILF